MKLLVLSSPICLDHKNLVIKLSFNKGLEFLEFLKNFRFESKQINSCKFAEIINKRNIILLPSY
jgi:hypothetical protein